MSAPVVSSPLERNGQTTAEQHLGGIQPFESSRSLIVNSHLASHLLDQVNERVCSSTPTPYATASHHQKETITVSVTVISGANSESSLPVVGSTVGQVRERFAGALNISSSAVATVNGERADADRTLEDGDELQFTKELAEKGK